MCYSEWTGCCMTGRSDNKVPWVTGFDVEKVCSLEQFSAHEKSDHFSLGENKKYNAFTALSQKPLQHCKATVGSTKNHYVKGTKKKKSLLFSVLSLSSSQSHFYFSLLLINSIITVSCKIIVHDSDVEKWRWSEALVCSGWSGTMFKVHDLKEGHKIKQQ